MMKKELGSVAKSILCVLFVLSLCMLPSCKKSDSAGGGTPPPDESTPTATPPADATGSTATTTGNTANTTPTTPATPTSPTTSTTVTATNAAGLVPVEIDLPKPMFVGTPQDTKVPNLEAPLGHARPPFLAPPGTKNVALGKPVSASDEEPIIGEIDYITDGDMEAADGSYVELGPFVQHVTVDLEAVHDIYQILIWHYHKQARVYFDVIVQVADDPDFVENVKTVFNNDIDNSAGFGIGTDKHYSETNEGKLIDVLNKGIKARYVRCYSNGNTSNDLNHYIEIAIFGKPAS